VLTGGYFEVGLELLPGHAITIPNSTGTVTVAGGILSSYVVRNGDAGVGIINLNGGALRMAAMHTLSATLDGSVNFNGGILSDGSYLDWSSSYANWIQSLTKLYVKAGGAHIEVNNSNGRTLLNGLLHDAALGGTPDGGLVKLGTGPLSLSGNNTYTGPTIVSNGLLRVNGGISASASLNVAAGGAVGGTGTLAATTIAAAGILAPGNSVGTLTVNGLTLQSNATNEWEKGAGVDNTDETVVNGNLTINTPVVVRVLPLAGATQDGPGVTNPVFTVSGTIGGFNNLQLDLSATPGWSGFLTLDTANNVGVVLLPEPTVLLALALGALFVARKER
jgi:autotransporter-associated beta strand protein